MRIAVRSLISALLLSLFFNYALAAPENTIEVPILAYHNLNPSVPGSMTITPQKFEEQLKWLKENGYNVIPLKNLVAYLQGKNITLPSKPVVITDDDGWSSVY